MLRPLPNDVTLWLSGDYDDDVLMMMMMMMMMKMNDGITISCRASFMKQICEHKLKSTAT